MIPLRSTRRMVMTAVLLFAILLNACFPQNTAPQIPPPPRMVVAITHPDDGGRFPAGGAVRIRAEVVSDVPIQKLELWLDGEQVEEFAPAAQDLRYLAHTWEWNANPPGEHTLIARAFDQSGEGAQSNILHISTMPDPGFIILYTTRAGDTLDQVAERLGSTVPLILSANPELGGDKLLPPNLLIRVPVGVGGVSFQPQSAERAALGGLKLAAPAPAAPVLSLVVEGCKVTLNVPAPADKPSGYDVYRLNQGGLAFAKIASVPAGDSGGLLFVDDGLTPGKYQYYAAAYTAGGNAVKVETPSNIAQAQVSSANCAAEVLTVAGLLPAAASFEQVYLYLKPGEGGWMRFPQGEFTFMKPTQQVSLAEIAAMTMPTASGASLQGEGWGWKNGELTFLGAFNRNLPASPATAGKAPLVMVDFLSSVLEARGVPIVDSGKYNWLKEMGFSKYTAHTFRWGTNTGADGGIWQVATLPFGSTPALKPACLLMAGSVPAGSLQSPTEFTIDFSQLAPEKLNISNTPKNQVNPGQIWLPNLSPTAPPYSPQVVFANANQQAGQVVQSPVSFDPCKISAEADGGKTFYIRVLPTKNNQLLSKPSNTVVFQYAPQTQLPVEIKNAPADTFYDIQIIEFTEINVPDYDYAMCVKIVNNPYYPSAYPKWGAAAPGTVVCPKTYTGGSDSPLEDFTDFIEKAVNFVADLYNDLSDFVTTLVEKLNPFCIQAQFIAGAVGTGEKEVKQACHAVAVLAVAAAKTYVGLPPSLPNFDQLTSLGKDYVVELAAEELESNGLPCPQECKDLIRKGVDYSLEQAKAAVSSHSCVSESEAHSMGVEPLCPPQGVTTVPDPRGVPALPTAVVKVTRRPASAAANIPQPASCRASLVGMASNDSYVGKTLNLYFGQATFTWQGTSLNNNLLSWSAPIPALAPGASVQIPAVLDAVPFWLPGHASWYGKWQNIPNYDDWAYLYQGANLALTAGGSCEFPGYFNSYSTNVVGETKNYGPLGDAYLQTCWPYCP